MSFPTPIASGEWQSVDHMIDFRTEWLTETLVERATWAPETPAISIEGRVVRAPGYVWFRFWLGEDDQIVEKYFDENGESAGMYVPVCMPFTRKGKQLSTDALGLAVWIEPEGRVLILNEDEFDHLVQTGELGPVEVEHAEFCIRKLTSAVAQDQFPPALVRNFNIQANTP